MVKEDNFDVAVVGAGPAGIIAAGTAAESGVKVILIDRNKQLGRKLLLTGGGRCNLTNAEFDLRKLVENYGKNGQFLFHAFYTFGPQKVMDFFEGIGVRCKIEKGNRVFPVSGKAEDVVCALKVYLQKNKVTTLFGSKVSRVILNGKKIEKLVVGQEEITAKKYIFCTGGKSYIITGSSGDGFEWTTDLGHKIIEPSPALVPIKTKEAWVKDIQGITINNAKISVLLNNKRILQETGDLLFTHFGLSGPAILNLSKGIGEQLKKGEVVVSVDVFPDITLEFLEKKILAEINRSPKKLVKGYLADLIPQRMVAGLIKNLGLNAEKIVNNITKEERKRIAYYLKNIKLTVVELLGFDLAMVTSGGVALGEIDDKTMKSKVINNLYFAGEIIDIDGKTGGFNLQACWSTGYLAAKSAAAAKK